jgi:plasmid stabilization system protein ParE
VALTIVWTQKAVLGYVDILNYIENKWTEKEVNAFEQQVADFLSRLSEQPNLLQVSETKDLRRGPINRLTIVTYRVREDRLEILNMRSARQSPEK